MTAVKRNIESAPSQESRLVKFTYPTQVVDRRRPTLPKLFIPCKKSEREMERYSKLVVVRLRNERIHLVRYLVFEFRYIRFFPPRIEPILKFDQTRPVQNDLLNTPMPQLHSDTIGYQRGIAQHREKEKASSFPFPIPFQNPINFSSNFLRSSPSITRNRDNVEIM